jgi:hypothetical protein
VLISSACFAQELPTPSSPQQINLLGHEPKADAIIGDRKPVIRVLLAGGGTNLDPASITLDIDNVDVSTQVKLDSSGVIYTPLTKMKGGVHTVRFMAKTRDGFDVPPVEWSFTVRRFAKIYEAGGFGTLTGSFERFATGDLDENAKRYRADANFELNYNLLTSSIFDFKTLSNLRFQTKPPFDVSEVDLANLSVTVKVGPTFFSVGDLVVHESDFVLANLSRRGVRLRYPLFNKHVELTGFMVRSESIVGFTHGFGVSDPNQRIDGGSLRLMPFTRLDALQMRYVLLSAKNLTNDGYTFGGFTRGYKNSLHSVGVSAALFENRLRGEVDFAWSDFDPNAVDGFAGDKDEGGQFRIEAVPIRGSLLNQSAELRLGLEGERIGTLFKSMGNPFLQPDREGLSANATARWGGVNMSGGWSAFHDNVEEFAQLPRVDNDAYSFGFHFDPGYYSPSSRRSWRWLPQVSLGYSVSTQESSREPQGVDSNAWPSLYPPFPRVDNEIVATNASAGYDLEKFSLYLDASRVKNTDQTNRQPNIRDLGVGLRLGARLWSNVQIGPGVTWNNTTSVANNRRSEFTTRTVTPSLTLLASLIPGQLTVQSHSSYTRARADNASLHTSGFNGSLQLDWHAEDLLGLPGRQTIGVRGLYFDNRSRVGQIFFVDRYQVFLSLNWVLPI